MRNIVFKKDDKEISRVIGMRHVPTMELLDLTDDDVARIINQSKKYGDPSITYEVIEIE